MIKIPENKKFFEHDNPPKINPAFEWVIRNAPPPKHNGVFYSYQYVFKQAYGYIGQDMGTQIRFDLEELIKELCVNYSIGVQLGVKVGGERGIRIFSLK